MIGRIVFFVTRHANLKNHVSRKMRLKFWLVKTTWYFQLTN